MSALNGIRVIELAESVAGEYCGRLLADFGADVVKVERPGCGSPTRAMAPLAADGPSPERSALFAYLGTNKRSVTLDVSTDSERLHALIDSADVVIDDHGPVWTRTVGVDEAQALVRHARVVFCSITPYGALAPDEFQNAKSLNVFHGSGWGLHTPSHADPALPPLKGPGRFVADFEAGLDAALCVAASVFAQRHTGAGEFIDVSQQAVVVSRADCVLGRFITGELAPENTRDDFDQRGPASFFECADGFGYLYMTNRGHWIALKQLLDQPDWLDEFDDDWLEFSVTPAKVAAFHRGFASWIAERRCEDTAEAAQRVGLPFVPVNDAADLHASAQYRHRRFFRDVTHPVVGTASYPTVPYLMSRSPAEITRPAPFLGEHTTEVLEALKTPRAHAIVDDSRLKAPKRSRGGPLEGVRVLELTKVWAGPYAGKQLAMLGAEVIKVETSTRPEEMRAYGGTDVNHAPFFLSINPEILSVDLDLKTVAGMAALRALIAKSDVVLNNLRPGAMERMGLGYDELVAISPAVISVSIKMWGSDGPLGYQTGYAPCFAALAGIASLVGYEGGPPLGASMRYGDSTVGAAAALGAVVALLHRERTGEGQFVDVSAVEVLSSMIGDRLVESSITGAPLRPDGNRHPDLCPHGVYPCADAEWISIAVADDEEWHRLCGALGASTLAGDARFSTPSDRHAHAEALDLALAEFTGGRDAGELASRLRSAGVAAAKSATATDVIGDQLLWDRGCFLFVSDHREGQRPVLGPSWRLSRSPARVERGAPDLGEDDDYVLGELLGGPIR